MNWTLLIAELGGYGLTQAKLAELCSCSQACISGLATGRAKEPRHSLGEALRKLLDQKRAEVAANSSFEKRAA